MFIHRMETYYHSTKKEARSLNELPKLMIVLNVLDVVFSASCVTVLVILQNTKFLVKARMSGARKYAF